MERLEKKQIKGQTYYYYSKWEWVNGKCRRIWQKYLGKPEKILKAFENNEPASPQYAEVFEFGLSTTLWNECLGSNIIEHVNALCPKRNQGLSSGEYIAMASINRAIHPVSKNSMFDWFSKTTLRRYFPSASKTALLSQRFWDHMDRIEPKTAILIWQNIITEVIEREKIDLSSICYDGTNFYTFIDTFNTQCPIAKRGKNKQGRSNLRQISYALFCSTDGQIPLYSEVYEGNRHDTKQFSLMIKKFHNFLKTNWGDEIPLPQMTLIFDKGNNSKDNFGLIDHLKFHYVGSVKLGEFKELAEISNQDSRFIACQTIGLETTKTFRIEKKVYGKLRTLIVSYNQDLFHPQWLTLHNDIEKAIEQLKIIQQKLEDRTNGLITKGKSPTINSIETQCKNILKRQYMRTVIWYRVSQGDNGVPQLEYEIDTKAINTLSDTYLGKNIIVTDRGEWNNEEIITAYRSQFNIENVFKEMKDRAIGSWWPLYHWTEQKIQIHSFYCTVAVLLRALAHRRVKKAGIKISMKRMLSELDHIKEIILLYPRKRGAKNKCQHTVLSKTSELQQSLLSILQGKETKNTELG
jgi:transposase